MKFFLLATLLIISNLSRAQATRIIGFYNVENLFDTIKSTDSWDDEFLPSAVKQWNTQKYTNKITHLAAVLDSLPYKPLIFGFSEVENKAVVGDLIKNTTQLKDFGIVHYESPDVRGIDVALIYDPKDVTILYSRPINVTIPTSKTHKTRDILYVKALTGKDTVHIFVNHWPSRYGGEETSEPNRIKAACIETLIIDSLLDININTKIISMGDLNDYSSNRAPQLIQQFLYPAIDSTSNKYGGSYNYKEEWGQLDHIYVSSNLLFSSKTKGIKLATEKGIIFTPKFLITKYKGVDTTKRYFVGNKYLGGYSDHLPVFIMVK
ncbi:MAG: endonuclease [Crocinitomicaceae bacterium]